MYKIQTLNKISVKGLDYLPREQYEIATEILNPAAIILRSYKMHDMELPKSLLAIARAGAGVNNIPIQRCTEQGIVVFNTPGANANSVKELVLASLFLASRKILQGIIWAQKIKDKGTEVPRLIEKEKSNFAGPELINKTLGVIGLGAIGVMVANAAISLGMNVIGFDPFISIESAWGLSSRVQRARGLETILSEADYITLHVPLNEETKGMINQERFSIMKTGTRLLNFARGGLINNDDLKNAVNSGKISIYITDFPDQELLNMKNVICIPHLGASTPEAEDNCAIMAVSQLKDYLERGNIKNSVNFPDCSMERHGISRITIANRNIPNMVGQITTVLANEKINISNMINQHRDDLAYNIIDIDQEITQNIIKKLLEIKGILMVRATG